MSIKVELLDNSFNLIRPRIEEFVTSFYENLFSAHPEFKVFFMKTDMVEQKKMLIGALTLALKNIHKPELIATTLKRLGARHVKYGAEADYYPSFCDALLITLEDYLDSHWTEEMKQAWIDAYNAITQLMLEGYEEERKKKAFYSHIK
ncbi:MAG: globin family protein [Prochloraceae cyanobacterium]|nr:globin family protein [Prochloraceae cyanobacterium]